jgi:hypothetical protein
MNIIGLTGYAQHGKDSAASTIVEEFGYERLAFADTLKSMALTLNPYIPDTSGGITRLEGVVNYHGGWEGAKVIPEVRRFLQVLGTEAVRGHLGDDIWVNALAIKMQPAGDYVISDVRFPNEAQMVHDLGGQVVRIVRVNESGSTFDNGLGTDHPSEQYVAELPVDATLVASDLGGLAHSVRQFMLNRTRKLQMPTPEELEDLFR